MKERMDNDEIGGVARLSSPKKLSRVGASLNSDTRQNIDGIIDKYLEMIKPNID